MGEGGAGEAAHAPQAGGGAGAGRARLAWACPPRGLGVRGLRAAVGGPSRWRWGPAAGGRG